MPLRRDNDTFDSEIAVIADRLEKLTRRVSKIAQRTTTTIQAIIKDDYADPVQGEVQWHYPWQRGYMWHNKEWRPLAPPTYHIKVFRDDRPVVAGADKFVLACSRDMHEMFLQDIEIYVTTPGTCEVMLRNRTTAVNMLTGNISTGGGSNSDLTEAETTALIEPVNSQVFWKNEVAIDVEVAGGYGLGVLLVFNPHNETHA